jgi:hypothetical protein
MSRSLRELSRPRPVAYWSQGAHHDWRGYGGRKRGSPTPDDLRLQAYHALASRITSLYWFNMGGKTVINNRGSLVEIQRVNREIMVVGSLLSKTTPSWWQNRFMDIDLNVLAGPYFAALFAIDLKYEVLKSNQFASAGKRSETMTFKIPAYLQKCDAAVKVTHEGISDVKVKIVEGNAEITDTFETNGMYILYHSETRDLKELLTKRFNQILATEASYQFDPINNNADFRLLSDEVNAEK